MATYNSDRRSMLKIIGAIGATCTYPFAGDELFAQAEHVHSSTGHTAQAARHFFNDADYAAISRIAELIIPETETAGAISAGVPAYIDLLVARNTDHQVLFADGLRWLDAESNRVWEKPFMRLTEEEQFSLLEPLCEAATSTTGTPGRNVQFFQAIKSLTADGYYTSETGLIEELGYKGNTARSDFPSCVHEH